MEGKIILISIPMDELVDRIAESVRKQLSKPPSEGDTSSKELLTRAETAKLLGITLPTLADYTRKRLLQGYRLGTRVRYKRSEVLDALRPIDGGNDTSRGDAQPRFRRRMKP